MRCEEFEIKLHEALDERRAPLADAALAEHAAGCAACRGMEGAISRVVRELAAEKLPAVGSDLAAIVVARLGKSDNEPPVRAMPASAPPRRQIIATLIATAAAVLLGCYLYWGNGSPQDGQTTPDVAVVQPTPTEPTPVAPQPVVPLPTLTELAQEQKESYSQLARDTARSWNDALAVATVFGGSGGPDVVEDDADRPWLREVGGGLAPITESTFGTLDLLRSIVPAEETRS